MRLATFNVENLFDRPAVMNLDTWDQGKKILQNFVTISTLIQKESYSQPDKQKMLEIMEKHKQYIILNKIRGKFVKQPRNAPKKIVANGRKDWIGWFELKRDKVKEIAIENTARVIRELNADIFCAVEAENRIVLNSFNKWVIPKIGGSVYDHVMLIDGNDIRGIDTGIMTRKSFKIHSMVSHIYDTDNKGIIFSRDCAEYFINTKLGNRVLVLINHFKSKGYGSQTSNDHKRKRQAQRVYEIYKKRLDEGFKYIAIVGDFNDYLDSDPLQPLLGNDSDLLDIMQHTKFVGDGRLGTFGNGNKRDKLDYILMSPELEKNVLQGGIERRGVWGGRNGDLFPHFPEIKTAKDAASDHAALWVDLDL